MRWDDTPYVKLYKGDGPWMDLSLEARGLFYELMRHVDRAGILRVGPDACKTIARVVNGDPKAVARYLDELSRDGCVTPCDGCVTIKNFAEAQEARASNRARAKWHRAKARDLALAEARDGATTENDSGDRNEGVTQRNATVTKGVILRREEKRREVIPSAAADASKLTVEASLRILDAESHGGYVYSAPDKGQAVTIQRFLANHADASTWHTMAAYIAAVYRGRGGEPLGTPLLAKKLGDLAAKSARWDSSGRPALGPVRSFKAQDAERVKAAEDDRPECKEWKI